VMRILDLFSGIGAFSLGLERAGMRTVAFCESDPFCQRVLAKHWPEVPCYDDVRTLTADQLRHDGIRVDVICGGFPCQDVSRAGKRAGLTGSNSGLYRELVRAIRLVRPKHAIVENVAALVGDGLDVVLGEMAEIGFDTEWDCVPASAVGAPHYRDRVWIVAHDAADAKSLQRNGCDYYAGSTGESLGQISEPGDSYRPNAANTTRVGRGQGRARRPSDSFAWIRDATRWHAGQAYRDGLEKWKCQSEDTREEYQAAERAAIGDVWQSQWPSEPALLGMDDGPSYRVERVKALGNSLVPQIAELIGRAVVDSR